MRIHATWETAPYGWDSMLSCRFTPKVFNKTGGEWYHLVMCYTARGKSPWCLCNRQTIKLHAPWFPAMDSDGDRASHVPDRSERSGRGRSLPWYSGASSWTIMNCSFVYVYIIYIWLNIQHIHVNIYIYIFKKKKLSINTSINQNHKR